MQLAIAHDLPLGPAYRDIDEVRADPHVRHRAVFIEGHHPHAGPYTYIGSPAIVDGARFSVWRPAPLLGEHTDELLKSIGYDAAQIAAYRQRGVV